MKAKMIFKYVNLMLLTMLLSSFTLKAGVISDNRTEKILLPTVKCGICKKNIETAVNKIDGVISIKVNIKKKNAVVTFDDSKTSLAAIENAVTMAGYDANDNKANKEAYDKLDECCKVP